MTDFAALVAELKDAALDAGATWDRCSDEYQKKLETRLHDAERALFAAIAAPTAKGGTPVRVWDDEQKTYVHVSSPPPAGAAGGGSGDLGALKAALADLTDAFLSRHGCFPLDRTNEQQRHWHKAMKRAYELVGQPNTPAREAAMEAPIPDLGAQGEPVAREVVAGKIQAIAEHWRGVNGGIYTIRAMSLEMADLFLTLIAHADGGGSDA